MPHRWSLLLRTTHWMIAFLFISNYWILSPGYKNHRLAGYILLVTLACRLIWGLMTHSPERLSAFRPSIKLAITHLITTFKTRQDSHVGHNPAGAIMIWLIWLGLIGTGISGWISQWIDFVYLDPVLTLHSLCADLTFIAVTIHVSAVLFMSWFTRRNYLNEITLARKLSPRDKK